MCKYIVVKQELYKKALKKLSRTYRNIDSDVQEYLKKINSKEDLGVELKSNVFKVRIANRDKNKGKSSGYRLISYLAVVKNELHLLYIYDKSRLVNVTEKEIEELITKQIKD